MTTLGTMRARIAKELGDPDDSAWTTSIETAIVDAITEYQAREFWFTQDRFVQSSDVTFSSVADQEYYDYPTTPALVTLEDLRILANSNEPHMLRRRHWGTIEDWSVPAAVGTGVPIDYAIRGEQIRVYPIPDKSTYTFYVAGVFKPTAIITVGGGDSQTNAWMVEGAKLIRNHAKKLVARDELHDGERAMAAELAEGEALTTLTAETQRRIGQGRVRACGPGMRRYRR